MSIYTPFKYGETFKIGKLNNKETYYIKYYFNNKFYTTKFTVNNKINNTIIGLMNFKCVCEFDGVVEANFNLKDNKYIVMYLKHKHTYIEFVKYGFITPILKGEILSYKKENYIYYKDNNKYKFRQSSISNIYNFNRLKCYFRHPKTTQEKRMSLSCDSEYVRAKRNINNLINLWDDISRNYYRSWKHNSKKRKQYM